MSTEQDFWQLTSAWIKAVQDRYANTDSDGLNQIFMRGPFAGMSERDLMELANRLDEAQKQFPLWPER